MIMLLRTCNNLMTNKKITVSKVITITLFAYLMGMVTEYYRYAYFFFPLMILSEKVGVIDRYLKVKASAADARSKPFQSVTDDGS